MVARSTKAAGASVAAAVDHHGAGAPRSGQQGKRRRRKSALTPDAIEDRGGKSFLLGLIGDGVQGSLSPVLHEREAARLGLRYVYRRIDLARLDLGAPDLSAVLRWAERFGFDGLNVTHPYKQAVIPLLDRLSTEAERIGAVNTVLLRDGGRIGHNTDAAGFSEGFKVTMGDARLGRVLQLGAGGAGAATASALLDLGVSKLVIADVDPGRAGALVEALRGLHGGQRIDVATDVERETLLADGLVNATPIGMTSHPGLPLPNTLLRPTLWVNDLIYAPPRTALIQAAQAIGARTANGAAMLAFQAAGSLTLFTGRPAEGLRMYRDIMAVLDERPDNPLIGGPAGGRSNG
jgi:shikimate dehydrogenase